jgi:hypothetical protein
VSDESDAETLPVDVQMLLLDAIESFDDLRVLLSLRREPRRAWDAESLAACIGIDPEAAETAVRALRRCGAVETSAGLYVWRPVETGLDETVARLARIYEERPLAVIQRMTNNAIERVRRSAAKRFGEALRGRGQRRDG